jgi:hypothetical protein
MGAESTNAEIMLAYVRAQLGKLYKLGSHRPAKFDCSGLTMEMVKLMGLRWAHTKSLLRSPLNGEYWEEVAEDA